MPDEKLTIEVEFAKALAGLGSVSNAVAGIGQGGLGAIGTGLGVAAKWGAFQFALGAAASALGGLVVAAKSAADTLVSFGRLKTGLGATGGETALLQVLGGALGISDIAGLAARVRAAGTTGLGAMEMARAGIPPQTDIGEGVNIGRILVRIIEHIRGATSEADALGRARRLGAQELAEAFTFGRREYQRMLQLAREIEKAFTPERVQQAREFNRELDRFGRNVDRIKVNIGAATLPPLNQVLEDPLLPFKLLLPGGLNRFIQQLSGDSPEVKATKENTAATRELANELRSGARAGMFGAGGGRGAIPAQFGPMGGFMLSRQLRAHAIRLGAQAISM